MDIEALLLEVGEGDPCGPDLEYDPAFLALEQAALGKPEVQYGETLSPAVPPEWKAVRQLARGLLERSRDLRLLVTLARSELALAGMAGLAGTLAAIAALLEERWAHVHPQLDADDGNDPTLRINSLALLTDPLFLREVRETPLLVLPGLGAFALRDLEFANGELPVPPGATVLELPSIAAAMLDVPAPVFGQAFDAVARASDGALRIEIALVREVGSAQALNLDPLTKLLKRAHDFLAAQAAARTGDAAGIGAAEAGLAQGLAEGGAAGGARQPATGDIASRADVIRMLDRIGQYYRQHEPSSPVPLLLERARRLVPKNFFEIIEDLAPDGLQQLLVVSGPRQDGPD
ncbi:type VI secretion system protein ImpA [Pseudoduganella lurida]|uniref:Type VI secretion system protein ImpA n=1 Tax=Pseudoduganella lurida TaxID=1036180 RepID=A0A562RK24_9BURK|nr:type VI secretion system protein TssA [Pseudoduganella lurida]TWI69407.1 type VI secretion system protein ImpA [Pseudoduganella lurida]